MQQVITAKEIAEVCDVSIGKAYEVIRRRNAELEAAGYLTFRGRVSRAYFYEKMYGMKEAGA